MAATTEAIDLTIVRRFAAPPALVFRIWEERDHLRRWLGPKGFTCTALEWSLQEGTPWRGCIESPSHPASWMSGVIREVVRDRRIVFTFAWEGGAEQPRVETLVTVDLAPLADGGTEQRFHQTPFVDAATRDSHVGGWSEVFEREAAYVEALTAEAQP